MSIVVFSWGRMNPITSGHEILVNKVQEIAKKNNATAKIYLSHSQDANKNPLSYETKIGLAQKAFGKNIISKSSANTFIKALQELDDKYDDLILVVGGDRIVEFEKLLTKYNGKDFKFNSFKVVSSGDRADPDSDEAKTLSAKSMSASVMRKLAKENNLEDFKKGLPRNLKPNASSILKSVRLGMNIREEISMKNIYQDFAKVLSEGRMGQLKMDLDELTPKEFQRKYKKTKEEMRSALSSSLKVNESTETDMVSIEITNASTGSKKIMKVSRDKAFQALNKARKNPVNSSARFVEEVELDEGTVPDYSKTSTSHLETLAVQAAKTPEEQRMKAAAMRELRNRKDRAYQKVKPQKTESVEIDESVEGGMEKHKGTPFMIRAKTKKGGESSTQTIRLNADNASKAKTLAVAHLKKKGMQVLELDVFKESPEEGTQERSEAEVLENKMVDDTVNTIFGGKNPYTNKGGALTPAQKSIIAKAAEKRKQALDKMYGYAKNK